MPIPASFKIEWITDVQHANIHIRDDAKQSGSLSQHLQMQPSIQHSMLIQIKSKMAMMKSEVITPDAYSPLPNIKTESCWSHSGLNRDNFNLRDSKFSKNSRVR